MGTQLLPGPGNRMRLEAGLDILHRQSEDWIREIEFWRDEVAFYHHLLERLDIPGEPSVSRGELSNMEKELVRISSEELEELRKDIYDHERFLSTVLKRRERVDENEYRNRHEQLADHIRDFNFRFTELKRYVFRLVKRIRPFAGRRA